MPDYTHFFGITDIQNALESEQLQANLVTHGNWCALSAGAFSTVRLTSSGAYGGNLSRLRPSNDARYTNGQVWEGFRKDWVWESGVEWSAQPIRVSGVYVDSTFYPLSTSGSYSHFVDYPNGRVIFNTAISPSAVVSCEYSYRMFSFVEADVPWWREVQFDSYRADSTSFLQSGSGSWAIPPENRMQLPAIVVECTAESSRTGKEAGSRVATVRKTVLFHVLTETPWDRNRLSDILGRYWKASVPLFNLNKMRESGVYPLDAYGSPNPSGLMYPDLVKINSQGGYSWQKAVFQDVRGIQQPSSPTPPFYRATVVAEVDVDVPQSV